jgi:hypothetical protein
LHSLRAPSNTQLFNDGRRGLTTLAFSCERT